MTSREMVAAIGEIYNETLILDKNHRVHGTARTPRFFAIKMIRDELKMSNRQIARVFGVEHTSIIYVRRELAKMLADSPALLVEYQSLVNTIRGMNNVECQ